MPISQALGLKHIIVPAHSISVLAYASSSRAVPALTLPLPSTPLAQPRLESRPYTSLSHALSLTASLLPFCVPLHAQQWMAFPR